MISLRLWGAWLGLALVAVPSEASAGSARSRPALDENDLARVAHEHPRARAFLTEGEVALASGAVERAAALFRNAAAEAPESALAARLQCQALVALGRRSQALAACREAVKRQGSPMDFRASVAALMAGPGQPTSEELAQAILLARSARETRPDEPWGYAAECDIARRLRDRELYGSCFSGLERVAPDDPETRRVAAELAGGSVIGSWLAWATLLLASFATLAHAFFKGRKRAALRASVSAALAALVTLSWGAEASASPAAPDAIALSKWPINQQNPEASLPSEHDREADPVEFGYLLMDLTDRAEAALGRGDQRSAVGFYRAVAKAVPDNNIAFRKLCESYAALGQRDAALESCRKAIGLPGVTNDDFARFVQVVIKKSGSLDASEARAVDEVVRHLNKQASGRLLANVVQCQLGAKLADEVRLAQCSAVLDQVAPNEPQTVTSLWQLAALRGDRVRAERLVGRAQELGRPASEIARMQQVSAELTPAWRKLLGDPRSYAALGLLVGAVLALGLARRSSRAALA
jgi:tetratricopeptide (TPR) repeat protein